MTEELYLHNYLAYTDGRGNIFLVTVAGLVKDMTRPNRALFFGSKKTLHSQSVHTWNERDGTWSVEFLDVAVSAGSRAIIRHAEGRTTLVCDARTEELLPLAAEERAPLLDGARFFGRRWVSFALGRERRDEFVYIDRAFNPERFRVFSGRRARMRWIDTFDADEVLRNGDETSIFIDGDVLGCQALTIAGSEECLMTWSRRDGTAHLVPMSRWKNYRLTEVELGVYQAAASPCSALGQSSRPGEEHE